VADNQSISLPPTGEGVRAARRFVRLFLDEPVPPPVAETAVLLTSELVANAVQHAGPHAPDATIGLRVTSTTKHVRVEVDDHSGTNPTIGDGATGNPSGRGMLLVNRLASRWGIERGSRGKTVWFAIDF
jgi:anti-sigma regulatory factor (Ser/Thr protein kinase)